MAVVRAVKGGQRLHAVDRAAQALGLAPGLPLADARARVPGLAVVPHDPAADEALLVRLAEDCDRATPMVALDPPDGLALDITGCAHLWGGEARLRARLMARIARLGVEARASVAGTPDAARALARFGGPAIVAPGEEAAAVRPLPIAALGPDDATRAALIRAGLKRVGDLSDRPTAPLTARFGTDLATRLRRVTGAEDARITPRRAVPDCAAEQAFADPIGRMEDVEASLALLLARVGHALERAGRGGRVFEAAFFRADGAVRRIRVGTGRPQRDPAVVGGLFRERLGALADPRDPGFGFDLIRLSVPVAEPLVPAQGLLDGGAAGTEAVADLLDRLTARFGRDRVLRFVPADTHDPVRASRTVPVLGTTPLSWPAPEPGEPPRRPLTVFAPPQPIEAMAEVPDGPPLRFRWRRVLHEIARAEGPERIAPEWWREAGPARDYYRVEDREGRRFWVFRVDPPDEAGPDAPRPAFPRWFLYGLFA